MNFRNLTAGLAAFCATTCLTTGLAFAQDNAAVQGNNTITIDADTVLQDTKVKDNVKGGISRDTGWYPKLHIGGTAQVSYNNHVDGVTDGVAFTFGLVVNFGLDAVADFGKNGKLEWINTIDLEDQMTKTPTIDDFVKSKDKLDFQTLLKYRIPSADWLAPFLSFRLQTSLFPSAYLSDKNVIVRKYDYNTAIDGKDADVAEIGSTHKGLLDASSVARAQQGYKLADSGNPLVLTEKVGLVLDAYESKPFNASFQVALAGQELIVANDEDDDASTWQYVSFDDDSDDAYYDIRRIVDTNSLGLDVTADFKGVVVECFNWNVFGRLYYPFVVDEDHGLDGADLIHAEIGAKVSVKISDWGSFDYTLEVKRDPFVTTLWQVSTNVLFTVGFDIFGK